MMRLDRNDEKRDLARRSVPSAARGAPRFASGAAGLVGDCGEPGRNHPPRCASRPLRKVNWSEVSPERRPRVFESESWPQRPIPWKNRISHPRWLASSSMVSRPPLAMPETP
jgi:hypothetical protein